MKEELEKIRLQAVLSSKADLANWAEVKAHYQENYGNTITDSHIIRRIIEQEASRTKSTSRRAVINQTWFLIFDLWSRITGNELTIDEVREMINSELGRDIDKT